MPQESIRKIYSPAEYHAAALDSKKLRDVQLSCTSPRTVGFMSDGKTISWSPKHYSKEYSTFQLPCGKCLECRLGYARQWAVRCVHEASMYEKNSFITLTYSDEHLKSPKLIYEDFQLFMKKLRKTQNEPIPMFVTGEYGNDVDEFGQPKKRIIHPIHGDVTKRPHWHAIVFNYSPGDLKPLRTTKQGHKTFTSDTLDEIWGLGRTELGSVTFESAGYCARYAAKKLVHGHDGTHEFEPISKKSSKHAIGKKWLEENYKSCFVHGELYIKLGAEKVPIPRYYEKWFKENHPEEHLCYITTTKLIHTERAQKRAQAEEDEYRATDDIRRSNGKALHPAKKKREIRKIIQNQKFKQLQAYLKL